VPQPPASFEEVLALHEKLKPQGIRALGWETGSPYFTWPLMAAVGPMSSSVASMAVMSRATPASTIRARCVRGSISSS
jgi:maltose-binding protein MalE